MPLRRNFLFSVGILVACNVLLAFGAIGLLTRMSPAIERILRENVFSHEAAEEMLVLLMPSAQELSSDARQRRFEHALQRAKANVTEPEEVSVLTRITQQYSAALVGDDRAKLAVVQALRELMAINRQAMVSADREAQRLGTAGTWVAVCIAVASFIISLIIIRHLERHVLNPLIELSDVLDAVRLGNPHRRCRLMEAPEELRRALNAVNALLDRGLRGSDGPFSQKAKAQANIEHRALLHLLEQCSDAVVIVDDRGNILAANSCSLDLISSPDGERFKQLLRQLPAEQPSDVHMTPVALTGVPGWLCVLRPSKAP
jgi:nitrogen fixation/metabolism regulation signal transduction histidine kinase